MTPDRSFLTAFFGPGNEIPWSGPYTDIGGDHTKVRPWVERYLVGERPAPLPRVRRVNGRYQTTWYVVVEDRDSAALARAEIQGFLGPSYTDWDPLVDRFDRSDTIDALVIGTHPHSLKVTITAPAGGHGYATKAQQVRDRLELWLSVRERQPSGLREESELLADLVYQFEDALRLGRLDLAEDNLRKIDLAGGLSSDNLAGLEFLLLEAREAWDDIWRKGAYDRLVEIGTPRRVSHAMLRAAYNSEVLRYQTTDDPLGALQVFRDEVAPRCAPLLGTGKGLESREAHLLRLLRELTRSTPAWGRVEAAKARALQAGSGQAWVDALVGAAGVAEPDTGAADADVYSRIGRDFGLNNLDTAWDLALHADPCAERSIWLMRLSLEADSSSWAHSALGSLEGLTAPSSMDVLERLQDRVLRHFLPAEEASGDESLPAGWLGWASQLGESERFVDGVALAENGEVEWDMSGFASGSWNKFASLLGSVSDANHPVLRRSVPHVLKAIDGAPDGDLGLGEVYEALLNVVLLDSAPGGTFFATLGDLLERQLVLGISPEAYVNLLDDIGDQGLQWLAPVNVLDLLEVVDTLFFQVCPSTEARLRFATSVLSVALTHVEQFTQPALAMLAEVADNLNWTENPFQGRLEVLRAGDASEEVDPAAALSGVTVALYSLDESALGRAKSALERLNGEVGVRLYSDKVASEPLLAAAGNADFFVIAHRSAKHAATEAIRDARRGPLEFAQGKGSSSLVRAVWEWAAEQA